MLPNDTVGWLMIIYRVPSTPSTSRVTVWKRVKELGAYSFQQSVYILPNLPKVKEAVNQLKEQISRLGGESKVIEIASLGEDQEKEVQAGFNSNRKEEYEEVIKACNELLHEIEDESNTEDFHFADLEENEKHIQRVKDLLEDVVGRDYFGSSLRDKALTLMDECQQRFDEFSHEVFSRDGMIGEDKRLPLEFGKKHRERKSLSKKALIIKMNEIVTGISNNTLEVEGRRIEKIPDVVDIELEYTEHKNDKSLGIKIEWVSSRPGKKT
jgi:DNA-binding transcriptional regulator PaaX